VRQLEDELGSPLFVRRGRRLESLTPLGEAIADEAGRVLEQVEHIRVLADDFRVRAG
jgi:LysR family cys regulon transcriptional activator